MEVELVNNGPGGKIGTHVDQNNQAHVFAVNKTVTQDAVSKGLAYNINSGLIELTSATESGILYFKNNESPIKGESTIVIDAIAIGIDDEGTTAGMTDITVIKNPTTGTLISGASTTNLINQNRNFGSSNTLDSLIYVGTEGSTVTDGEDFALLKQQPGTRGYYNIDIELPKGSSIAIKMDTDTSANSTWVYVALICHRKDGNNS